MKLICHTDPPIFFVLKNPPKKSKQKAIKGYVLAEFKEKNPDFFPQYADKRQYM